MNNGVEPQPTGGTHWLRFLPDHVYCFLPSFDIDKGEVEAHQGLPYFLKNFLYSMEILKTKFIPATETSKKNQNKTEPAKKWKKNTTRNGKPEIFFNFERPARNSVEIPTITKTRKKETTRKEI